LHGSNPEPPMSALGQEQTLMTAWAMSALPPKADIHRRERDVRFVPKAHIASLNRSFRSRAVSEIIPAKMRRAAMRFPQSDVQRRQ
jgi:hypothetical protein